VKPPSSCLTSRQNLQLRNWGIRRKETMLNSNSVNRICEIHFKVKMTACLKKQRIILSKIGSSNEFPQVSLLRSENC
jgi:hypothetical protein